MIQLIAYSQDETSQTVLDLSEATTVSLSYSIAELGEVTTRNSPFSQSFRLPQSEKNNKFFEHWYEVNLSTATFDARKKTRCVILDEGVLVIAGYLQLREVYNTDRSYTVSIFGDQANLYQEIGKKTLRDAFLIDGEADTDYNYSTTDQNIIDSWDTSNDITNGSVGDGVIIVPLQDPGSGGDDRIHFSYAGGGPYPYAGIGAPGYLPAWALRPCIQVKHVFYKIFNQAGYSITSTFLESATFTKIYMTLAGDFDVAAGVPIGGARVGMTQDQTISEATEVVEFDDDSTGINFDDEGAWDTTSYTYVAPVDLELACTVTINVSATGGADAAFYVLIDTPQGTYTSPEYFIPAPFTPTFAPYFTGIVMDAGEELQVSVVVTEGQITIESDVSNFFVNGVDSIVEQPTALVAESIPDDIKQTDFVKDIIQRFNLILEAAPDNERNLIIEPYNDWVDSGNTIDWTGKLDEGKEVVLKPTNEYKKSVINFSDLEGEDETNHTYQERNGWVYGRHYEIIDDDFAKGELKNDPIFKPFHVHQIPQQGSNETLIPEVLIPRFYRINEGIYEPITDKPSLFYHNGLVDANATLYIGDTATTEFPYCAAYNETPSDEATTLSLYWDYQYPTSFGTPTFGSDYVKRNLWREYWGRFHNQIYSREARVLVAYFYLTPTDILNLRFNDAIRVKEGVYRLLKIEGYTVNGYETTKCELIKEVSSLPYPVDEDCNLVPDRYNADGTITFVNVTTSATTLNPGQYCCELHGGAFNLSNNQCYWNHPRHTGRTLRIDDGESMPRTGNQRTQDDQKYTTDKMSMVSRRTVLRAEVDEGSTGYATESGTGVGYIQLPYNSVCRITANVVSTQTTYNGSSGALGATSLRQYFIICKNVEGRVYSDITENTDVRTDDGDVTNRAVAVSVVSKGGALTSLDRDIRISCTGETFARVDFVLDCEVTYTDLSRAVKDQNQMLHQDGATIILQNGTVLTR